MNIGDIAEMAGVSRAAVSRYLNDGYISGEKRERIRKVIEETGYRPSLMAQTLRTKKTRLVGVVLPRIHSDSISALTGGIGSVLNEAGYNMLLATTENHPDRELDYLRIFSRNRVDGIILIGTVITEEHKRVLGDIKIPVVVAGQEMEGQCCVYHDDYHAGRELVRLVIDSGRKHIAYIGVMREDVAVGQRRFDGYAAALREAGLALLDRAVVQADFSKESGAEALKRLLPAFPEMDALIGATDSIAYGAVCALREAGRRVPEDVAVAGFGDNIISSVMTPGMTTVRFHYREEGETAARKILAMLGTQGREEPTVQLSYEIIVRGTAG